MTVRVHWRARKVADHEEDSRLQGAREGILGHSGGQRERPQHVRDGGSIADGDVLLELQPQEGAGGEEWYTVAQGCLTDGGRTP